MSHNSDNENEEPQRNLEDVEAEVKESFLKSFQSLDSEGLGYIKSSDLQHVTELMGIKMEDNEIYKIICEVDPGNRGYLG